MLAEWNEKINLVSRRSFEDVFGAHLVDSLWIADVALRFAEARPLFDVGTGAGFPGIVVAARYPDRPITLYEKLEKRRKFLTEVIQELKLPWVTLKAGMPEHPQKGFFMARAVFPRDRLLKIFRQRLLPESRFLVMLGGSAEPGPTPSLFHKLDQVRYRLPEAYGERQIEVFEVVPRGTK